jgi:hypothetical protein
MPCIYQPTNISLGKLPPTPSVILSVRSNHQNHLSLPSSLRLGTPSLKAVVRSLSPTCLPQGRAEVEVLIRSQAQSFGKTFFMIRPF